MALHFKDYSLNDSSVDAVSADVQNYLTRLNAESRNVQRIRLTVEELLLNVKGSQDTVNISVGIGKQFGRHVVRLLYKGDPFDPTKNSDNPWADDIMRSLGVYPSWSYRRNVNTVSLILSDRPKRSSLFYIVLAVIAAVLFGVIGNHFPQTVRQAIDESLLLPASDAFLGLLTTFSGLMIAFTVCNGMLGMGDSASTGRMGRSVVMRFILISFIISIASAAVSLPFLNLNFAAGGDGQTSPLKQLSRLFFDILPTNVVDPFRIGNALQIIVIALIIGIALIAIGERGGRIRDLINETATLLQRAVSMVCTLVPLFVFVLLLRQIWSGEISAFLSIIKPMLLIFAVILAFALIIWPVSSFRLKCPPVLLLKKTLPPFLVALTTASSMSAMTLGMETCEKKLGVKKSTVSFLYPLGSVIYMPASIVFFTILAVSCAEIYNVEVGLTWLITAVIVSTLLAVALPPIPGAGMLGFTVLFTSLGIPTEALALATAMNIVFEFYDTGFNVLLLNFQIACESVRFGSTDRKILLDNQRRP